LKTLSSVGVSLKKNKTYSLQKTPMERVSTLSSEAYEFVEFSLFVGDSFVYGR